MTVQTLSVSRTRAGGARTHRDNSVALVLIVMMGIVFGPIIGVHAVAALGAAPSSVSAPADAASVALPTTRSPG